MYRNTRKQLLMLCGLASALGLLCYYNDLSFDESASRGRRALLGMVAYPTSKTVVERIMVQNCPTRETHVEDPINRLHTHNNRSDGAPVNNSHLLSVRERFDTRAVHARFVCKQNPSVLTLKSRQTWDKFARNRLRVCSIPKSGSTYLNFVLGPTVVVDNNGNDLPVPFTDERRRRFVVVREPYSRVVSAFLSKAVGHPAWFGNILNQRILHHRPNASAVSLKCGHDVTFNEYIKFIIQIHQDPERKYDNPHFIRMAELCNVCADPIEFIAKLETLKDDMDYILHTVDTKGETSAKFIEIKHLAEVFMSYTQTFKDCGAPMCYMIERYWWSQQAIGHIAIDMKMPFLGKDCDHVTGGQLANVAWDAHLRSKARVEYSKSKQKRQVMTDLYRNVPLQDRITLRKLLKLECALFEYNDSPEFVFSAEEIKQLGDK